MKFTCFSFLCADATDCWGMATQSSDWSKKKSVPLISNGAFRLSNYPNCHLGMLSTDGQPACQAIGRFLYICPASDLQKDILVKATGTALRGHSECWHTMSINSSVAVSAVRSVLANQASPAARACCTVLPESAEKQQTVRQTKISLSWHRHKLCLIALRLSVEGSSPPGI